MDESALILKRARTEDENSQQLIVSSDGTGKGQLIQSVKRTSSLAAPILALTGHGSEILSLCLSPSGETLASSSLSRQILLFNIYAPPPFSSHLLLRGPKAAITCIKFSPSAPEEILYGAAADGSVTRWNMKTGEVERRWKVHGAVVNAIAVNGISQSDIIASASDDGVVHILSPSSKQPLDTIELGYPVTAISFSLDGQLLFLGGVDEDVHAYALAGKKGVVWSLRGHSGTIAGMRLSPDGSYLATAGMDNTLRVWDVRPFAPLPTTNAHPRLLSVLPLTLSPSILTTPAFSPSSKHLACGSSDRTVCIFEWKTGRLKYKLPGHKGVIGGVEWSSKFGEEVVCSGAADGIIYVGEVDCGGE